MKDTFNLIVSFMILAVVAYVVFWLIGLFIFLTPFLLAIGVIFCAIYGLGHLIKLW